VSYVISISSFSTCTDELPGMDDREKNGSVTRTERILKNTVNILRLLYGSGCLR
jgi:hypothetical protein